MHIKSRLRAYIAGVIYLFVEFFLPYLHRRNWGKTCILLFHHLDKPTVFRKVLVKLKKRYNIISFNQYLASEIAINKVNIIISFDDGYKSWYTKGLNLFVEFNISPLFFVNSDFIDRDNDFSYVYCKSNIRTWPEESLTWDELSVFVHKEFEVGGHCLGHIDLLGKEYSAVFKANAIITDRNLIAEKLGYVPRIFSYPYGRYDDEIVQQVAATGYQYAFTSDFGFLAKEQLPFKIKRINVGMRPPIVVCAFVEGWSSSITLGIRWLRQLLGIR